MSEALPGLLTAPDHEDCCDGRSRGVSVMRRTGERDEAPEIVFVYDNSIAGLDASDESPMPVVAWLRPALEEEFREHTGARIRLLTKCNAGDMLRAASGKSAVFVRIHWHDITDEFNPSWTEGFELEHEASSRTCTFRVYSRRSPDGSSSP